jgi:short-subunit dehydrogenase
MQSIARVLVSVARAHNDPLDYDGRTVSWVVGKWRDLYWEKIEGEASFPMDPVLQGQGILGFAVEDVESGQELLTASITTASGTHSWLWRRRAVRGSLATQLKHYARLRLDGGREELPLSTPPPDAEFARLLTMILASRRPLRGAVMQSGLWLSPPAELDAKLVNTQAILDELRASKLEVDFLVNNAGYAINGGFAANEWSAHADFLQVMVTSWLHLAHGLLPAMVRKGRGRVLNVSSLASLCPEPPGSLYAPSKALMTTASRALRFELLGTGVHCTALCPGFTYTEFHDALGVRAQMDTMPKYMWQHARPVCLAGLEGVERNKAIVVPGAFNKTAAALCRVLPYALTSKLIPKAVVER